MIKKPKLKNCLRWEKIDSEGIFLLSEKGSEYLGDSLSQKLIPFLDGTRTEQEIVTQLRNEVSEAYIYYALMELEQKGLLVENEEVIDQNFALLCESLGVDAKEGEKRLQSTRVALRALGSKSRPNLKDSLERSRIQIAEEGEIEIIVTDDYLREELAEINRINLERNRPWILIKPIGIIIWIGPIFHPLKTGCWQCLAQRLRNNRSSERFIQRRRESFSPLTPPVVDVPTIEQIGVGIGTNEILKWILKGKNPRLEGAIVTYDTRSLDIQNHTLVKRPQCPDCGLLKAKRDRPLPVILGSRKKKFTTDGGHRCLTPEETLKTYQHHISPISGVLRSLEKISSDCNGLAHVYNAKHHWASVFDDLDNLQRNIGGRSAGKGRTDVQARASGFCEGIERYSGVFQGDEMRIQSSYQRLGDWAIHPNACMNFSRAQYENRELWNAGRGVDIFQRVPEPFDEVREIDWSPVWSLTQQEFKYLPTAYCYFGYPQAPNPDCWANTNGCAAGNTLEEAVVQGFLELVERDSAALWWYNRLQRPRVDLESFDEPYFQAISNYYQSIGREIWVLDITFDLNIPTFVAISRQCDRQAEDIILGLGTHFDPKLAIQRALTEIGQILPAVVYANADGRTQYPPKSESHILDWWKTATLENQPYLVSDRYLAPKSSADYKSVWHEDLLEDIKYCQQLVEEKGMEMLVLDQTRPDIGLNVVKVIVPGLRHFWKRLGLGRLYDVPVQMGCLDRPLTEEELNPIPLWM